MTLQSKKREIQKKIVYLRLKLGSHLSYCTKITRVNWEMLGNWKILIWEYEDYPLSTNDFLLQTCIFLCFKNFLQPTKNQLMTHWQVLVHVLGNTELKFYLFENYSNPTDSGEKQSKTVNTAFWVCSSQNRVTNQLDKIAYSCA